MQPFTRANLTTKLSDLLPEEVDHLVLVPFSLSRVSSSIEGRVHQIDPNRQKCNMLTLLSIIHKQSRVNAFGNVVAQMMMSQSSFTGFVESGAMAIMFDAVMRSGAATKDTFVLTSVVNESHPADSNPPISPSSNDGSMNTWLSGGTDHLADTDESSRVPVRRLSNPSVKQSPSPGIRRVGTLSVDVFSTQDLFINAGLKSRVSFAFTFGVFVMLF